MDKFSYTEEKRDGQVLDVLTNESSGLRLKVSRQGAEPVSLARMDADGIWHGFLNRDGLIEPAQGVWSGHSTVMGYFTHRLLGGRTTYKGRPLHGGTHSFVRTKVFKAPLFNERSLTYSISPGEFTAEEYPLKLAMHVTYSIEGDTWRTTFRFDNLEEKEPAHFSFGLHPGFSGGSLAECQLNMPPGTYIRHLAPGNFLSGETVEIRHPGGPMPFSKEEMPGSVLLELKDVPVPLFVFTDTATGRQVDMNYTGAPYLTIWSDGNAFLCVEPCWGLPDSHRQTSFEEKHGIQELAPMASLTRSFTITPRLR